MWPRGMFLPIKTLVLACRFGQMFHGNALRALPISGLRGGVLLCSPGGDRGGPRRFRSRAVRAVVDGGLALQ